MDNRKQLDEARERVIETVAQNMNLYGVTPSVGRLYGALFFSDGPLTLDDMTEILGMSKTSMSTSIRTLADLNMVEKVWRKGVRRDLYIVEEDWYETFASLFTTKWRNAVMMNINAIEKSIKQFEQIRDTGELSADLQKSIDKDIEKLTYTLEYYDWLNRLIDSFETKTIFEFIPKQPAPNRDND